jgi:hypothetical protein
VRSKRPQPQDTASQEPASKTDLAADLEGLGEIMMIQGTMQREFLRVILRRLATDVPAFQSEMFLAELQFIMESLEAGKDKSALHAFALKEWARLSEMALGAIASTRAPPEKH